MTDRAAELLSVHLLYQPPHVALTETLERLDAEARAAEYSVLIDADCPSVYEADHYNNGKARVWDYYPNADQPTTAELVGEGNLFVSVSGSYSAPPRGMWVLICWESTNVAHWDSGQADIPTYIYSAWDPQDRVIRRAEISRQRALNGMDRSDDRPTPDSVAEEARAFNEAVAFLDSLKQPARDADKAHKEPFRKGDVVKVFKGRKCPLGTYRVVTSGTSQYGPWVNLETLDRTGRHAYISQDNVRHDRPTGDELIRATYGAAPHVAGMVLELFRGEWPTALLTLCDAWEDADDQPSAPHREHLRNYARSQVNPSGATT